MHVALADFATSYPRFQLDTAYLIDQPLTALRSILEHRPEEWAFLVDVAARTKDEIRTFASDGLDRGVIHGDLTLDNLLVAEDGRSHRWTAEEVHARLARQLTRLRSLAAWGRG